MNTIATKSTAQALAPQHRWQRRGVRFAQALILPFALILGWSMASASAWIDPKVLPSPAAVFNILTATLTDAVFWQGVAASLARNLTAYLLGASLGVGFALIIGSSKIANWLLAPSFHMLRQISLFAWLPILSSFLGTGNSAKILFISLAVFYPVALHSLQGIRSISHKHREVAAVYQFPWAYRYQKLILPAAAPQIFVGLQLGLVFAWLATIGSEFLLASHGVGIGQWVIRGREQFNVGLIMVGMLAIGSLGLLFNRILVAIERRVLTWNVR